MRRSGTRAVAGVFAAYAVLYWHHVTGTDLSFLEQVSYFLGSCSVICMTGGMVLSARPRMIESGFGGLDRMYRLHKYLGVAALALFLAHFATLPAAGGTPKTRPPPSRIFPGKRPTRTSCPSTSSE